jgi:hypothetical protein
MGLNMPVKEKTIRLSIGTLRLKKTKHLWAFERWGDVPSLRLGDHWIIWHPRGLKTEDCRLCMIHIGKTGGTALKFVLSQHNQRRTSDLIELYRHEMTLPILVDKSRVTRAIFFVRDPVARYVSAFNSRFSRVHGNKRLNWSAEERFAFSRFTEPNELAEALSNSSQRPDAERAMRGIQHVREPLSFYLGSVDFLDTNKDRIFFIGRQEAFDHDVVRLQRMLRVEPEILPPTSIPDANRTRPTMSTQLTRRATDNIKAWYQEDYPILEWCLEHRKRILEQNFTK